MWQRFSENARKTLFYAHEEAMKFSEGYVSTEHLLLGLLRQRDCLAYSVLSKLGADHKQIQRDIESQLPRQEPGPKEGMTLTPRAKRVIDLAYDSARELNDNHIGTEHLLLGLIQDSQGLAATVLEKHSVTYEKARQATAAIRGNSGAQRQMVALSQEWILPVIHLGDHVRLEPLETKHASDLAEACDDEMFRYFPVYPASFDKTGLEDYIRLRTRTPVTVAYAIIDQKTNRAIGSSSFFDIRPQDKGLEIGHTWIKKEHRGTNVNPETKLLMFTYAFETCGAIRVQQKTDLRNVQSQKAMLKMGCKQEGILRHNMVMPDGYVRDSVYFSVLAEEWPEVKAGLIARLKS